MGVDEEGTLRDLKELRATFLHPKVAEHRGRIVKTTGDGVLIEFPSVVDAIRCAVEMQCGMAERNRDVPTGRRIELRMGINLGDIIIGLSRIKWLYVVARNSTFVYKGRAVDVKQIGRELEVRYVLEGSLRKAGNRVRITAQLIEAASGTHVWAERYDRALDDIFDVQDEITLSVIGAIEPSLRQAEIERAKRKRPEGLGAYDLYLRALPTAHVFMPGEADRALALLGQALN